MSKNKPNTLANQLRKAGYSTLNDKIDRKNNVTMCGVNPPKELYRALWTQYDLNQYCSMVQWAGLPNGLTSWNLNRMLYFRGSLAGFEFAGKVYVLPYAIRGLINPYGLPTSIMPITYNGGAPSGDDSFFGKDFSLPVDFYGNEKSDKRNSAFLLYDNIPYTPSSLSVPRHKLNQTIIAEIADVLARVNINVTISNKKIILIAKDPKMADVIRSELNALFNSESPFGVVTSELDLGNVQSVGDYNADELFNTVKNWDAIRCFMSGIRSKNFGTEKKERVITAELEGNETQINLIGDMRLELAALWAEQMNDAFGTNISCSLRTDKYAESDGRYLNDEMFGEVKE